MNSLEDIKGNPLRIMTFLYRNKKDSVFATRGSIVNRFYVSNRFPEKESKPDDDINFLMNTVLD